jgi:hypothetical protein
MGLSILVEILIICLFYVVTDRQGLHAGWDHRLCEVPTGSSQGKEDSPLFLQYCFWQIYKNIL